MIRITETKADFEREKLKIPFGFKGGYLTELWQCITRLSSSSGISKVGLGTQSVLYGDHALFASLSEAGGNALMYSLTERALGLLKSIPFETPVDLIDSLLPLLREDAGRMSAKKDLDENFVLNSLTGIDHAAWLVYAAEHNMADFEAMIPALYRPALSHRNEQVGVLFQVSYGMPLSSIEQAIEQGYFLIKIKTGHPGTQEEMLRKDMERLSEIHRLAGHGNIRYTIDANGRYERKETLQRFVDHAVKIGAADRILFIEEPLDEGNRDQVGDIGIPVAADESIHRVEDVLKRIEQGYGVLVLKSIAKTLSVTLKMAKTAFEHNIPCVCADLTVNPILVDWHKNLAARLAPFPGLDMGILETNGDMNYRNWETMKAYHPVSGASWTRVQNGLFELDPDFFRRSGGIFEPSAHYESLI